MTLFFQFLTVSIVCGLLAFAAKEIMREIEKKNQKKPKILG